GFNEGGGSPGISLGGKSLGLGGVVLTLVGLYFGVDPSILMQATGIGSSTTVAPPIQSSPAQHNSQEDQLAKFVSTVLADTEDTWHEIFRAKGKQYIE